MFLVARTPEPNRERMTRQDYTIIADTLNMANVPEDQKRYLAELFSDTLLAENPRFDRDKFIHRIMEGAV